jgi:hypothetical protein
MKKLPALFFCFIACTIIVTGCIHGSDDTSLSFNDSDHYFFMKAYFSKNKTRDVERYLDKRIGRRNNMFFVNSEIDGKLALDDHTTFYIKKSDGILKIKLDKNENSEEACERIRSMCEGIKKVLTK